MARLLVKCLRAVNQNPTPHPRTTLLSVPVFLLQLILKKQALKLRGIVLAGGLLALGTFVPPRMIVPRAAPPPSKKYFGFSWCTFI